MENIVIYSGHLDYFAIIGYIVGEFGNFVVLGYIFPRFGVLCSEKSGNPDKQ
jgi:hypothetical protein